ncbi:FeS cluster biogenesis domain protein [mine drainage metagenome]|uniref:FeS cluster biogenesis domain protein n=1 Tax=mine drainage metagenome TaxID=410659 RepID=T1CTF0_9ZZZZ
MVELEVRPAALDQIKTLIRGQKPDVGVRVYAQAGGGGCCGGGAGMVQFGMAFAKPRADDVVVKVQGLSLIVDPSSVPMVDGAVVDYVENLDESGFKITNPKLPTPDRGGWPGAAAPAGRVRGTAAAVGAAGTEFSRTSALSHGRAGHTLPCRPARAVGVGLPGR